MTIATATAEQFPAFAPYISAHEAAGREARQSRRAVRVWEDRNGVTHHIGGIATMEIPEETRAEGRALWARVRRAEAAERRAWCVITGGGYAGTIDDHHDRLVARNALLDQRLAAGRTATDEEWDAIVEAARAGDGPNGTPAGQLGGWVERQCRYYHWLDNGQYAGTGGGIQAHRDSGPVSEHRGERTDDELLVESVQNTNNGRTFHISAARLPLEMVEIFRPGPYFDGPGFAELIAPALARIGQ